MQPVEKYFEPHDYINDEPHYHCAYCGWLVHVDETTVDHVIPSSRGGANHKSNLLPCCYKCNQDKGDQLLSEWVRVLKDQRVKERVKCLIEFYNEDWVELPRKTVLFKKRNKPLDDKFKGRQHKVVSEVRKSDSFAKRMSEIYGDADREFKECDLDLTGRMTKAYGHDFKNAPIFDYDAQGNIVRVDSN